MTGIKSITFVILVESSNPPTGSPSRGSVYPAVIGVVIAGEFFLSFLKMFVTSLDKNCYWFNQHCP